MEDRLIMRSRDAALLLPCRPVCSPEDEPSFHGVNLSGRILEVTPAIRLADHQQRETSSLSPTYASLWRERLQLSEDNLKRSKRTASSRPTKDRAPRRRPPRKCSQCSVPLQYKGSLCSLCRSSTPRSVFCPCGKKLRSGRGLDTVGAEKPALCYLCASRARRVPLDVRRAYVEARKQTANVRCEVCDKLLRWSSASRRCKLHPLSFKLPSPPPL